MSADDRWNCADVRARTAEHLDGELAPAEARGVDAHLAGCPDCRAGWEAERRLLADMRRRVQAVRAPEAVRARLRAALAHALKEEISSRAPHDVTDA